uniref:Uncharacterized protein n=1 Tax=Cacopsylla melanoneura TaxID=428564 RepID=A0A8D9FAD3_9HEMI
MRCASHSTWWRNHSSVFTGVRRTPCIRLRSQSRTKWARSPAGRSCSSLLGSDSNPRPTVYRARCSSRRVILRSGLPSAVRACRRCWDSMVPRYLHCPSSLLTPRLCRMISLL